jgi:hypothetical protein
LTDPVARSATRPTATYLYWAASGSVRPTH